MAIGERTQKLFVMMFRVEQPERDLIHEAQAIVAAADTLNTWHQKLVHQNFNKVKRVLSHFDIKVKDTSEPFCDACAVGKSHHLPFPVNSTKSTSIGEIIHADVCGPMEETTLNGSLKVLLTFERRFFTFLFCVLLGSKIGCGGLYWTFLKENRKTLSKRCQDFQI